MSSQASSVRPVRESADRSFIFGMGIACTLIIVIGFAPTFFLAPFFERPRAEGSWSIYLQLHAAIFTAWIALFVTQATLIRADRRDLHMRLGVLGLVLAVAIVSINILTVTDAIAAGRTAPVGPPIKRLWVAMSASVVAGGFILAGLWWRRDRETHKRLMLLATINMVSPAVNRLTREFDLATLLDVDMGSISRAVLAGLVGVCIVNDYVRRKRVHPAYLAGLVVMLGARGLSDVVPNTDAWRAFATWATG